MSQRGSARTSQEGRGRNAAKGFLLGALIGICLSRLGVDGIVRPLEYLAVPLAALAGAGMALTRTRPLLWAAAVLSVAAWGVVAYTPLVRVLMPLVERQDRLRPMPAIVVLSASQHRDKTMNAAGQQRVIEGYTLLRQGMAPRLVLTNEVVPYGSAVPTVRRQMQMLGLNYPVDEVGPVFDTHDEAVRVAQLARERGWHQVILVTHIWHARRAAAVFEKAGLPVLCAPCVETEYDLSALKSPDDRLHAFRDWLHEIIGYQIYRLRGWI